MLKGSFGYKPWVKKESKAEDEEKKQLDQNWKDQQAEKNKTKGKAGAADNSNNWVDRLLVTTSQKKWKIPWKI